MSVATFEELTPNVRPERSLLGNARKSGGRNNQGVITIRYQGGGHKQRYRLIDFRRDKLEFLHAWKVLNTIQIAQLVLHFCITQMAKSVTSLLQIN